MRSRPDLSPAAVRELDAIDRALAGDPVDPDLAELRDLALALRDERPEPTDGFRLELEAWMAERDEHRRLALPRVRRGMLLPALGAASVVALGSTVALVLRDDGPKPTTASAIRGQRPATGKVAPGALPAQTGAPLAKTAPAAPETAGGQAGAATPAPPAADAVAAPPAAARGPRRVERSASLTLATPPRKVSDVADGVVRVTDAAGGYVATSDVSSTDRGGGGATFDLRIPTSRLDTTLARLSALAHVRSRSQSGQDVTGAFRGTTERLAEARAERSSLLRRLARATTANEAASIRARLRLVARQIAAIEGELHRLRARTDFSVVSVTITPDRHAATGGGGGGWTPRDALRDALRVLAVALGVALVALAVILPLALVGIPAWLAARGSRRRRREHALDAI